MKIALVSPYDYAYPGGVTQHMNGLAAEFQRQGHETHIIAPSSNPQIDTHFVPFHRLGRPMSFPINGSVARIGLAPRLNREVKGVLATGGFDIVHVHEPLATFLPLAVLRASRATNVGTFHAFRRTALAYLYAKPFLQYFFAKLHGKIAVSPSARDFVAEHFPGANRVIPNGIEFERFNRPTSPITQYKDGALNVLFLGRLEKRKGLSHLLRAWGTVRTVVPNARLIVVGGGRGLAHYRKFVQTRAQDDIVFAGVASEDEKVQYYHTADVFCAPSTGQESFGIVLLEAMAAGKPIVATDIPGFRDVVTDGREALLVPPKSPDALARGLVTLLESPDLRVRLATQGVETARQYAWEHVASEVLSFYAETIHRRSLLNRLRRPRFRRVRRVASGVAHLLTR